MTRAEKELSIFHLSPQKKFYENYAQEIVKDSYNGAIKDFIAAFTAGNKLSAAEKAELLSYIQTLLIKEMLNKKAVINNSLFLLQNYYKYRIREITQTLLYFPT